MTQLNERTGSVLIFVRTKRGADRMAEKLSGLGQSAAAIHGNLNQNQRNRVIQAFRDKKHRVMVATDVAARGLDIPHIEHVINYDLPQQPEDYIHRIGRTARNGEEGSAVCFITPEDGDLWREIHKLLNPGAAREEYRGGANPAAPARTSRPKSHNRGGFEARRQRNSGKKKTSAFGGQGGGENFRPRAEGRSENRGGFRSENRSENRGAPRGENRGGGNFRSDNRNGGRSENRGGEPRGGDRGGFRSRDGGSKGGNRGGNGPFGQRRNAA
jgi:superfamily II DNA/RNA helicase